MYKYTFYYFQFVQEQSIRKNIIVIIPTMQKPPEYISYAQ